MQLNTKIIILSKVLTWAKKYNEGGHHHSKIALRSKI